MGPHRVAIASMGVPKRPQMRDARTESAGVGNHRRVTVGSMGAPRNPQMRGTHQVRSLRTKTSGAWSPLSGHGLLNECFQEAQNEIHAASPQPAHKNNRSQRVTECFEEAQSEIHAPSPQPADKKRGHSWVNGCAQEDKKEIHASSPQPAHKEKCHGWVNGCHRKAPKAIYAPSAQPAHKNKGGVESTVGPVSITLNTIKR